MTTTSTSVVNGPTGLSLATRVQQPEPDSVLLQTVAASVCGADLRIARGDKASDGRDLSVVMGHEACAIVTDAMNSGFASGDLVIPLPHVHKGFDDCGCKRTTGEIAARCTSRGHTRHAGWDFDGVFGTVVQMPASNLVAVPLEVRAALEGAGSRFGVAGLTMTEPVMCCLTAAHVLEEQQQVLRNTALNQIGTALIVGAGPIGIFHGIILQSFGYHVTFADPQAPRLELARRCCPMASTWVPADQEFDLVMVTANVGAAVVKAEQHVRDGGAIYLFSGLNSRDREMAHPDGLFRYETLHRRAQGVIANTGGKNVLYVGHSGYSADLAEPAMRMIAAHNSQFEPVLTGVIPGFDSHIIQATSATSPSVQFDQPALLSVLGGADLSRHGKVAVLTQPR